MYNPPHFRQEDRAQLDAFIDANPLATLVATTKDGLEANHLPLLRSTMPNGHMLLRGHIARGNTLWQKLQEDAPVLVVFAGPQHYISPGWYPTKQQTGEVVPTWNYLAVHAHGSVRFFQDRTWLRTLVGDLTDRQEARQTSPWKVDDAPAPYLDKMLAAIVGFEVVVDRLEGKFKSSQNRTDAERAGVVSALTAEGLDSATVAQLVRTRSTPPA